MSALRSLLLCLFVAAPLNAVAPPVVRLDSEGRPLPAGAVARLGTTHPREPGLVAFTGDGKQLLTFVANRGLYRWDVASGKLIGVVSADRLAGLVPDLWIVSRDGRLAVEVLLDTIRIVETTTGRIRHRLLGDPERVHAVALSPDSKTLASSGTTGVVRLYDVATGRIVRRIPTLFNTPSVDWVAFAPDGKTLVTGTGWAQVDLWDLATGEHRASLGATRAVPPGRSDPLRMRGQISPTGETLYVSCGDQVQTWDLLEKRHGGAFAGSADWPAGGDARVSLSFDGRLLARLDRSGRLELWETISGKRLHSFAEVGRAAAFAGGGWSLANGRRDDQSVPVRQMRELFLELPSPAAGKETAEQLWEEMAHRDPARAHRALWKLAGKRGVEKFVESRMPIMSKLNAQRLKELLDGLGSDHFETRQKAEQELVRVADSSREMLERARRNSSDLEVRFRLARVLSKAPAGSRDATRDLRAVMLLEATGTAAARKVLERVAGSGDSRLSRDAKATLSRMAAKR